MLVAVIVTSCEVETLLEAVNVLDPVDVAADKVPTAGLTVQETLGVLVPVTVAVSDIASPGWMVVLAAVKVTLTGATVMVVLALAPGSTVLVARTVVVIGAATVAGARYNPFVSMEPTTGSSDQVTLCDALLTVAAN